MLDFSPNLMNKLVVVFQKMKNFMKLHRKTSSSMGGPYYWETFYKILEKVSQKTNYFYKFFRTSL